MPSSEVVGEDRATRNPRTPEDDTMSPRACNPAAEYETPFGAQASLSVPVRGQEHEKRFPPRCLKPVRKLP